MMAGVCLAIAGGLALASLPRPASPPPLVHVPAERLIWRDGDHDVVHALQDIVETSDALPIPLVAAPSSETLQAEAAMLLARIEASELSELAKLQLRRMWDLASTETERAEALAQLREKLAD